MISLRLVPIRPWTDDNGTVHSPPPSITENFVKRDVKEKFYRARYNLKNNLPGILLVFHQRRRIKFSSPKVLLRQGRNYLKQH